MNKIFCFGDGYAHGHIWPEWPQILKCLFPTHEVVITSGIGSGNEFLVKKLLDFKEQIKNQLVIFQWASPVRFDKIIEDDMWNDIAVSDSVYGNNLYQDTNLTWWLSSASTNPHILKYHDFFVQPKQAKIRMNIYQTLVENYLQNQKCHAVFTSTLEEQNFSNQEQYQTVRGIEVQPSPIVHLDFLVQKLLPQTKLEPYPAVLKYVKNVIESRQWEPYHEDRFAELEEIIKHSRNLL